MNGAIQHQLRLPIATCETGLVFVGIDWQQLGDYCRTFLYLRFHSNPAPFQGHNTVNYTFHTAQGPTMCLTSPGGWACKFNHIERRSWGNEYSVKILLFWIPFSLDGDSPSLPPTLCQVCGPRDQPYKRRVVDLDQQVGRQRSVSYDTPGNDEWRRRWLNSRKSRDYITLTVPLVPHTHTHTLSHLVQLLLGQTLQRQGCHG